MIKKIWNYIVYVDACLAEEIANLHERAKNNFYNNSGAYVIIFDLLAFVGFIIGLIYLAKPTFPFSKEYGWVAAFGGLCALIVAEHLMKYRRDNGKME